MQKYVISETQGGSILTKHTPKALCCCPLSSVLFLGTYVCLLSFLHEVQGKRPSQMDDLGCPYTFPKPPTDK